jgi:predicted permease
MLDDIRYAFRSLSRRPLLTCVAAMTLGLGIGGATAVFSVVDAVLLRALPFENPDRLVRIWELTRSGDRFSVSEPAFRDLAATSRALRPIAAYREHDVGAVLADGGEPLAINAVPVSASLVEVLGVRPQLGRMFTAGEDGPGVVERRIVLSDGLWRSRFTASTDIVGRVVRVDGNPLTVTGVMPPGFDFPAEADAWVQLRADPNADHGDKALAVVARLAPGATPEQAAGELRELSRRWAQASPATNSGWSAEAVTFNEWMISPRFKDAVRALFGAVTLLLLLACANVANLLVAQAASRRGEMRVRTAVGAGRARLVRQLFTEAAALAALSTVIGMLIALWSVEAVRQLGGSGLPRLETLRVDGSVLLFACVAGVLSCLAFGLAPAMYTTRVDLRTGLDEGVRYTSRSRGFRQTLVVVEVALALLLLVGAGLLGNSFVRLLNTDPGFDVEGTLAMPIEHRSARYPDDRVANFYRDLLAGVVNIPGITAAGATTTNPFRQGGYSNSVTPEDRAAEAPPSGLVQAGWRSVTPGFFEAMRIPILAGRAFSNSDHDQAEPVVVVSESLAQRLWPDESPVGKRIYWGGTSGRTRTVVGMSRDIRDVQLEAEPAPVLFLPHAQVPVPLLTVVVRTSQPIERIGPSIRQQLRNIDAGLPTPSIYRLTGSRAEATMPYRFNLSLLAAFAAIALVLALTGVYAMLSFMVGERRREIAVRLALGASGSQVARLVLTSGLRLSVLGAGLGIGGAVAATQLLSRLLYGIEPTDPLTFTLATTALLAAAAIACYLPARQASRVDAAAVLNRTV